MSSPSCQTASAGSLSNSFVAGWKRGRLARALRIGFFVVSGLVLCGSTPQPAQVSITNSVVDVAGMAAVPSQAADTSFGLPSPLQVERLLSPDGLASTLNVMLLFTVLSLAPSILMMTTCFIRFVIVLSLLRQALGTQQLPPNQVIVSLCLFLTLMVMSPVWHESYEQGLRPYTQPLPGQSPPSLSTTFKNTVRPLRQFMSEQIAHTGNEEAIFTLLRFQRPDTQSVAGGRAHEPETFDEVPLSVLLPAYMLSELKTAFVIGFRLYLPFVVIDMVVSSLLLSMGMMMMPPVLVSLPFKLLMFVLIDGWFLTVGMMLESVATPFG